MTTIIDPPVRRPDVPEPEPYPLAPDVPFDRISWRIDSKPFSIQNGRGRARYIAYIDARTAAEILDEWVGPDRWQPRYEPGELFGQKIVWCYLTVEFPNGRTVTKPDLGVFTSGRGDSADAKLNTSLKGVVSDAFKRAAVAFGVGRNVYALPEVWGPCAVSGTGDRVKARPVPEATRFIENELRKAGLDVTIGGIDAGAESDDEPPGDEHLPDVSERIENAAKLAVWRLYGTDDSDEPFDAAKPEAARLWKLALEESGVTGVFDDEKATLVIGTAEAILDREALERAAATRPPVQPGADRPFVAGEKEPT